MRCCYFVTTSLFGWAQTLNKPCNSNYFRKRSFNITVVQTPQCTSPTVHHFVTENVTCVHIFIIKWCIVGYLSDALWDLWLVYWQQLWNLYTWGHSISCKTHVACFTKEVNQCLSKPSLVKQVTVEKPICLQQLPFPNKMCWHEKHSIVSMWVKYESITCTRWHQPNNQWRLKVNWISSKTQQVKLAHAFVMYGTIHCHKNCVNLI